MPPEIRAVGIEGLPEVRAGDDLATQIIEAAAAQGTPIEDGDVVVVTQKIVSKAEGRVMTIDEVEASPLACGNHRGAPAGSAAHGDDPARKPACSQDGPRRHHQRDLPRLHLRQRRDRRVQHTGLELDLPAARRPRRVGPSHPGRNPRATGRGHSRARVRHFRTAVAQRCDQRVHRRGWDSTR